MTRTTITGNRLPKLVVATALAIAALAATPLAEAGLGMPQQAPRRGEAPAHHRAC